MEYMLSLKINSQGIFMDLENAKTIILIVKRQVITYDFNLINT